MHTHKQYNMQHTEQDTDTDTETNIQPQRTEHSYISVTYRLHTHHRIQNTEHTIHTYTSTQSTDTEQKTKQYAAHRTRKRTIQ